MSSLRSLQNVSIVLLCLWILTLLQALSDLFDEFEVFPYESPAQQYRQQAFRQAIKKRRYHPGMKHHHRNRTRSHNHSSGILDGNRAGEDVLYKQPRGRSNKKQLPPHGRNIFRRGSKSEPLNLPKPVIVVGFPKAGTSSVFAFFRRQKRALKCQHWFCCSNQRDAQAGGPGLMADCMLRNLIHNRTIFHRCGRFDVFAEINGPRPVVNHKNRNDPRFPPAVLLDDGSLDLESYEEKNRTRIFFPQYFNLLDIHEAFPNATFVLNLRDFDSWIESIQSWHDPNLDWQFINEFYRRGELDSLPEDRYNRTQKAAFMRIIYDKHHEQIRQFVRDFPSHAMVEVPILDPNAGTILADAFGLDASYWGKVNANRGPRSQTAETVMFLQNLVPDFDEEPRQAFFTVFAVAVACSLAVLRGTRFLVQRYFVLKRTRPQQQQRRTLNS